MYPQAICAFRDAEEMDRVLDGLTLVPKHPAYLRIVCKESHEKLSLVVLSFLRKEEVPLEKRTPLQHFMFTHGKEREFVHLFSVKDDFGMVYHLTCIKKTTVNFTIPYKVRPHAGAMAWGHCTLNVDDFKRRLFDNPRVYREYKEFERSSDFSTMPIYMKKHFFLLDPTANQRSRYKEDSKVKPDFQSTTTVATKEEMADIKRGITKQMRKIMAQKQCAWAGCGKVDGNMGKFSHCNACSRVSYCSKACQRNDWPSHKLVCKTKRLEKVLHSPE